MEEWKQAGKWATAETSDNGYWDHETGAPTLDHFGNALQVWSVMQERDTTVAEAALAFNVPPRRIVEAVEEHHWMFLTGPDDDFTRLMIEHEGE